MLQLNDRISKENIAGEGEESGSGEEWQWVITNHSLWL